MFNKRKYLAAAIFISLVLLSLGFFYWVGVTAEEMDEFEKVARETMEREEYHFTILHTNDEHSALVPHTPPAGEQPDDSAIPIGGFARLATAVSQLRSQKSAEEEPVLLVSAGDFLGGTPYGWLALQEQAVELELMQFMGYDVITLGNHEFDFGPDALAAYLGNAGYPEAQARTALVATNMIVPQDHPLKEKEFKHTHMIELDNGLKVGFLGLLGEDAIRVMPDPYPITFQPSFQAAREGVRLLQYQGADVIVAVTHAGLRWDQRLAKDVPGINVIVGGHSHTRLYNPVIEKDTIIVQAGSDISHLGILELTYDKVSGSITIRNSETGRPHLMPIEEPLAFYPAVEELIRTYTRELEDFLENLTGGRFSSLLEPITFADQPLPNHYALRETALGNFVTDAMRLVVEEKTGKRVDFAFQTNGQIRGTLNPGGIEEKKGFVSFYDLAKLSGMGIGPDGTPGYPLVSVYLTGEEVRRMLELSALLSQHLGNPYFLQVSGLRYRYNPRLSILLNVPFKNIPLPTGRAVLQAERYTGDGRQTLAKEDFVPLKRGDRELYHVVTGYHLFNALPAIGRHLPHLNIVPKDSEGEPIEDLPEAVVKVEGQELKVWQVLAEYASSQPALGAGSTWATGYYVSATGRIQQDWRLPSFMLAALFGLVLMLFYLAIKVKPFFSRIIKRLRS